MQIRWLAMVTALGAGYLQLVTASYDTAESQVRSFYSQMLAANFRGAQRSIDEAVRLWPEIARYHGWRGYSLSQSLPPQCPLQAALTQGQLQKAREATAEYRLALQLNERDAVAHHNLAWLSHLVGDNGGARQEWLRAIAIDPDNAVFHLSLGMFLEESGDSSNADNQIVTAIGLSPAILDSPFFTRHESSKSIRVGDIKVEVKRQPEPPSSFQSGHSDNRNVER